LDILYITYVHDLHTVLATLYLQATIWTDYTDTIFFHGSTALVGQGLLTTEASRSHSVGLLWTSDQAKHRDLYLTTFTRDRH